MRNRKKKKGANRKQNRQKQIYCVILHAPLQEGGEHFVKEFIHLCKKINQKILHSFALPTNLPNLATATILPPLKKGPTRVRLGYFFIALHFSRFTDAQIFIVRIPCPVNPQLFPLLSFCPVLSCPFPLLHTRCKSSQALETGKERMGENILYTKKSVVRPCYYFLARHQEHGLKGLANCRGWF